MENTHMKLRRDMSPEYSWQLVHIQLPQSGTHYQVYHGHHAVQLSLVDRDLGVDGVLTLLLLHCIVHSVHNTCHHLLIKIPGDILEEENLKIFYYSIKKFKLPRI